MAVTKIEEDSDFRSDPVLIAELERKFSPRGIRRQRIRRYQPVLWLAWVNALEASKRFCDLAISGVLLLALLPVLIAIYSGNRLQGGGLVRSARVGRWGLIFNEYSFTGRFAQKLPMLFNVWRGEMSLIGPRPISPADVSAAERLIWKRFNIRPGLLCLWWIRSRANIAYGSEVGSDVEYVETQSFLGDIGIALRAVPAALYGEGVTVAPDQISLLGIDINNLTMDEVVDQIVRRARGGISTKVSFVNADCANIAWKNPAYHEVLCESDLVLADGIGMKLAGRLLNRNIRQNVNGTDLLPRLLSAMESEGLGLFLFGAKPGVATDVESWVKKTYPGLAVCGTQHGYLTNDELPKALEKISTSNAKVLLVALGAPKQEMWINAHLREAGAMVALGVGGLFDFYSGRIPRAPTWVREIGMEWCFRFCQEPRRMWSRYFTGNLVFIARVLRAGLRSAEHS